MAREQFLIETLSPLFVEKRSVPRRRKGDTSLAVRPGPRQPDEHAGVRLSRWVQRDGRRVRVCTAFGPFSGRVHVFYMPSNSSALEFAVALLKTDADGYPAPIDPVEWALWQAELM